MNGLLIAVAALHALFMLCELFPWSSPVLLRIVSKTLPDGQDWTPAQLRLVATVVHNAGIYNAVFAGGLAWAATAGESGRQVALVLLAGAAVAGTFGTLTLKSPVTALQALAGVAGLVWIGKPGIAH